jgi:hypothetical protein
VNLTTRTNIAAVSSVGSCHRTALLDLAVFLSCAQHSVLLELDPTARFASVSAAA